MITVHDYFILNFFDLKFLRIKRYDKLEMNFTIFEFRFSHSKTSNR